MAETWETGPGLGPGPRPGSAPRWVPLIEVAALVWGGALLVVVALLSRLGETHTVVVSLSGGGHATYTVEAPVLQGPTIVLYAPGAVIVLCSLTALAVTVFWRPGDRLRPDTVCFMGAGLVVLVAVVALVDLVVPGLVVLPAAVLLLAAGAATSHTGWLDR